MPTENDACFQLYSPNPDAPPPVLVDVSARGRLDAVLFELTLRQTFRNAGPRALEVIYTFPLPPAAVLLGFTSTLDGQPRDGVVVATAQAEQDYEAALQEGDAPVMLTARPDGIHTANIGNLKPGEEIVLETRIAQLLNFEQGRLRVAIPTVIGPRYGRPAEAGLHPEQAPVYGTGVATPFALALTVGPSLADAAVTCQTHPIFPVAGARGEREFRLAADAMLDRDTVFIITPREPRPSLLCTSSNPADAVAPLTMMAAMQVAKRETEDAWRQGITIKVLVDCSGSMAGDSIGSARVALRGVVEGLTPLDQLSLSRFGSSIDTVFAPAPARPPALRHLRSIIDQLQADLGGTEMEAALRTVFELPRDAGRRVADVLLITDGDIWQADTLITAARGSGHRVFAIGVGSSPGESVLRALAEATGGACEFATPGEALEEAARRMLQRMRQPTYANVRVEWDGRPSWTQDPPPFIFPGDTVLAFAGFGTPPDRAGARLLADDAQGRTVELARTEAAAPGPGDAVPRIAAARRLVRLDAGAALALALEHQLMSAHTQCILVHRRTAADKTDTLPELHRVPSMIPAGWGGWGTAMQNVRMGAAVFGAASSPIDQPPAQCASLEKLARSIGDHLALRGSLEDVERAHAWMGIHPDLQAVILAVQTLGATSEEAWLLLAHWVNVRRRGLADDDLAALLAPSLATLAPGLWPRAEEAFERSLSRYRNQEWSRPPVQRLKRALQWIGV